MIFLPVAKIRINRFLSCFHGNNIRTICILLTEDSSALSGKSCHRYALSPMAGWIPLCHNFLHYPFSTRNEIKTLVRIFFYPFFIRLFQ